jgi:hypothetical protein
LGFRVKSVDLFMSAGWLALFVGLALAAVAIASSLFRRHAPVDLGTVSHQWIAEQRFGANHDPRR